ncbi:multidrug resistance protein EbrB [Fontibacillus phaseoli]|uniref:Multidrug resistance protein EbrB n=1 Tax=Fontibacillus phaseoli TaxID=1416533 RepID=A0A369BQ53_9BACL|nr:multidrug efflux SMR transporter [Fontibacillus phaseoli]RCX23772.1 multidrug resistance protein EbrB [Fontibacillus phaseoli]
MNRYVALVIAIVSEVFGTNMLKMSDGFTNLLPSMGVIAGFGLSFYFLSISLKTLPLSIAYGIWSGVGTAITAMIGVFVWGDPFNMLIAIGLILIIGGVVLLNAPQKQKVASKMI